MPFIMAVPGHIDKIFSDPPEKTETRRVVSIYKKGPRKGEIVPPRKVWSLQQIIRKMFGPSHGVVRVLSVTMEPLLLITEDQAMAEGGYGREEYIKGFLEMNPLCYYLDDISGEIISRKRHRSDHVWRYVFYPVKREVVK